MNTAEIITHHGSTYEQIPPALALVLILVLWPTAIYLTIRNRKVTSEPWETGMNQATAGLREDPEPWASRLNPQWRGDCPEAFPEYLSTWGIEYAPRPPATFFALSQLPDAETVRATARVTASY